MFFTKCSSGDFQIFGATPSSFSLLSLDGSQVNGATLTGARTTLAGHGELGRFVFDPMVYIWFIYGYFLVNDG